MTKKTHTYGKLPIIATIILGAIACVVFVDTLNSLSERTQIVNNPIERAALVYPSVSTYKYFYEFKPDPNATGLNTEGFRDRYDYSKSKRDDVVRIMTLGDSHTYGVGVDVSENFSEVLEDMLQDAPVCDGKQFEVINIGMQGYDVLYAAERFRLKGALYEPDLLIWYVRGGDFIQYTEEEEARKDKLSQSGVEITDEIHLDILHAIQEEYGFEGMVELQTSAIRDTATDFEVPIVVVSGEEYIGGGALGHILETSDPEMVDVYLPFYELPEDMLIPNDYHPNERGHTYIAEALYRYLQEYTAQLCP